MAVVQLALLIVLAGPFAQSSATAPSRGRDCAEWRTCRQLALDAAERGEYETFHDLAWRAVQTGPPKDPSLMYLLARAQALSNRPHDALIMLRRLTEMGVAPDVTIPDFNLTREQRDWPEVEARIAAAAAAPVSLSPGTPVAGKPGGGKPAAESRSSAAPALPVVTLPPAAQMVRFSATQFAISGVAYDAVSSRFVVGDRTGRKLIAVDERSNNIVDLVRADSAGFLDIMAVEIDAKRGDLWVASAVPADGTGTLHRLQLISGRPLRAFQVAGDLGPVKLVDLAVGRAGTILVLDAMTPQLLVLPSGGTAIERALRLDALEPVSLAVGRDDEVAFVAHRAGVSRIDLRSQATSLVSLPKGVSLGRLERIRWNGSGLIAVQVDGDGTRSVIRLEMNAAGSAITRATRLETSAPMTGQTFVTISGAELVYVAPGSGGRGVPDASSDQSEFVAFRVPLR